MAILKQNLIFRKLQNVTSLVDVVRELGRLVHANVVTQNHLGSAF